MVIDPSGQHRTVGRKSVDLIEYGGYRIGAGQVELAFLAHPSVNEVAVSGITDDDLGQRPVTYVGPHVDVATLTDTVAASTQSTSFPARFASWRIRRATRGQGQKARLMSA